MSAIADTIRALSEDYNAAWEELSVARIIDFHGAGFEYYWFDRKITDEFAELVGNVWLSDTQEYSIEMFEPSVEVLGQDAAVISFSFRDRQVFVSGEVATTQGLLSYVFERRDGGWKIVRVHHSGPVPEGYYG